MVPSTTGVPVDTGGVDVAGEDTEEQAKAKNSTNPGKPSCRAATARFQVLRMATGSLPMLVDFIRVIPVNIHWRRDIAPTVTKDSDLERWTHRWSTIHHLGKGSSARPAGALHDHASSRCCRTWLLAAPFSTVWHFPSLRVVLPTHGRGLRRRRDPPARRWPGRAHPPGWRRAVP